MKWWVFNEDQLAAALTDWIEATIAESPLAAPMLELTPDIVRAFLNSDEARAHKLRGDPSE